MAGSSLEDIQDEFADLDLPITDDDVLERLQVWVFLEIIMSVSSWILKHLAILNSLSFIF